MTKGEYEYAERQALKILDDWIECTGFLSPSDSYYQELCGIISDAVHCGVQTALFGNVKTDNDGNVVRYRIEQ